MPQAEPKKKRDSKKDRILAYWNAGHRDLWWIAQDLGSKPSYVAAVLQKHGILHNYYDLYTRPESPPNIYFGFFENRLGFKTVETANESVALIEKTYRRLEELRDRAGQHHCMVAALTMYNRARFCGKGAEAEPYRLWLVANLRALAPDVGRMAG